MIPNQWYVVLGSNAVKDRPVAVTRLGEKLVFWRDRQGQVACLLDKCPHRGVRLSAGAVIANHLQCPFHGFEFDSRGQVRLIPANGKNAPLPKGMRACGYPVHEAHGFIWIWWGPNPPADLAPPRFFEDIDERFSFGEARDLWKAHYSRAIENQLDAVHLPFVHHDTIGRGGKTLVDGPAVKWVDQDMFFVYVRNRIDDGSKALRPSEVPLDPEPGFKLEFIFPNLWQNHISDNLRIVVAFVPVDAEHSILYLRSYQKFMTIPILAQVVNWLSMPLNLHILHQDRRVVETQTPQASALRMGEFLIPGDYPIVEYRRRRAELRGESGYPA